MNSHFLVGGGSGNSSGRGDAGSRGASDGAGGGDCCNDCPAGR